MRVNLWDRTLPRALRLGPARDARGRRHRPLRVRPARARGRAWSCWSRELPRCRRAPGDRPARRHGALHDAPRRRLGGPVRVAERRPATDDDPERVAANRERVRAQAGAARLAQGRQVHGTHVVVDGQGGEEADGQVTTRRGVAAIVLVADCLPVALAGPGRRRRACTRAGAGWPAACSRRAWRPSGAAPVAAAIGPGIGPCCYEVGDDVRAVVRHAASARSTSRRSPARACRRPAWTEIHDCGLCTACDPERFFSHRRDRGVTGRQAGLAWRS